MHNVTRILNAIDQGDEIAADELLPLVYDELRKLAAAKIRRETANHSIQPTMLVHEAWLRLAKPEESASGSGWKSRSHFFGAAAEAMRRILVEDARRRKSAKRGGKLQRFPIENVQPQIDGLQLDLIDLDHALSEFESQWPDHAKVVKLRYFAGLTIAETSDALDISHATTERHWAFARTWLYKRLKASDEN